MSSTALARIAETDPTASRGADHDRASELARKYIHFAWRVARRLGLGPVDAEDVAQRAMVVACLKVSALEAGSERAFVYRTVANLVSKVYRTRRRRPEEPESAGGDPIDPEANPEAELERRRARETLDAILQTLSPDLRAAFVLFEIEGMSQPEIAQALGIPTGTVASRLRRARAEFTRTAVRRGVLPDTAKRSP